MERFQGTKTQKAIYLTLRTIECIFNGIYMLFLHIFKLFPITWTLKEQKIFNDDDNILYHNNLVGNYNRSIHYL